MDYEPYNDIRQRFIPRAQKSTECASISTITCVGFLSVLHDVLESGSDSIGSNATSKIEELFKTPKFFVRCIINGEKVWRTGLEVRRFSRHTTHNAFSIRYLHHRKLVEEGFVDRSVDWVCSDWKDILAKDNPEWPERVEDFFGDPDAFYKMYPKIVSDVNKRLPVIKEILSDTRYYTKLSTLKILDSALLDDITDYRGVAPILSPVCRNETSGTKRKRNDHGGEDLKKKKKLRKYDDKQSRNGDNAPDCGAYDSSEEDYQTPDRDSPEPEESFWNSTVSNTTRAPQTHFLVDEIFANTPGLSCLDSSKVLHPFPVMARLRAYHEYMNLVDICGSFYVNFRSLGISFTSDMIASMTYLAQQRKIYYEQYGDHNGTEFREVDRFSSVYEKLPLISVHVALHYSVSGLFFLCPPPMKETLKKWVSEVEMTLILPNRNPEARTEDDDSVLMTLESFVSSIASPVRTPQNDPVPKSFEFANMRAFVLTRSMVSVSLLCDVINREYILFDSHSKRVIDTRPRGDSQCTIANGPFSCLKILYSHIGLLPGERDFIDICEIRLDKSDFESIRRGCSEILNTAPK